MQSLPLVARVYVLTVTAAGAWLAASALVGLRHTHLPTFTAMLVLAVLTSVFKIAVPMPATLNREPLTMSLAFAANFASLVILDADSAIVIAVVAAWSQTTFNTFRARNPWHRTVFNMAALAVTMAATDVALRNVAGHPRPWDMRGDALALGAAAATYYVVNSGVVAAAIAAAGTQPLMTCRIHRLKNGCVPAAAMAPATTPELTT